jgi:hypothetical protein
VGNVCSFTRLVCWVGRSSIQVAKHVNTTAEYPVFLRERHLVDKMLQLLLAIHALPQARSHHRSLESRDILRSLRVPVNRSWCSFMTVACLWQSHQRRKDKAKSNARHKEVAVPDGACGCSAKCPGTRALANAKDAQCRTCDRTRCLKHATTACKCTNM